VQQLTTLYLGVKISVTRLKGCRLECLEAKIQDLRLEGCRLIASIMSEGKDSSARPRSMPATMSGGKY